MIKPFAATTIAFVAYNSAVIVWEMGKDGNTICPKCAYTRLAVGAGLAAWALWLMTRE
jgi:hypothetical protein